MIADVFVPLAYTLIVSLLAGALGLFVWLALEKSPWYATGAVFFALWLVLFGKLTAPLWRDDRQRLKVRGTEEKTVAGPAEPYIARAEVKTSPRQYLYMELQLRTAKDQWAWHRFCKAIHFDGKNFSGQEARRHKFSGFNKVYNIFLARGWCTPKEPQKAPELTGDGLNMIEAFANSEPPTPSP